MNRDSISIPRGLPLRFLSFLTAFVCLLLCGCGGGSGGGGNEPALPATRTVDYVPGMYWLLSGRYRVETGEFGFAGDLQSNRIITTTNFEGRDYLLSRGRVVLDTQETLTSQVVYQDSNASIHVHANDHGKLKADITSLPGEWSAGLVLSGVTENEDGFRETYTFTVLNAEKVKTPVSTFATWKCHVTRSTDTYQTVGDYWYAPEIGYYVKASYTTTFTSGEFARNINTYNVTLDEYGIQ